MRRLVLLSVACLWCVPAVAQSRTSDEALLAKASSLYDAPFTRNLGSFNCAVQFDWQEHFVELLGSLPPALSPTANRLQGVQHRVFVDRSGAKFLEMPKAPDFAGDARATTLKQVLNAMVTQGLNAWLPFSRSVILPVGPAKYNFEKVDSGYKLTMNVPGAASTILFDAALRVTSGVFLPPQSLRFTTIFTRGPDGYLLESLRTEPTEGSDTGGVASFAYTYQTVQEFQLPMEITVSPATTKPWHFTLTDCRAVTFRIVHVAPPPSMP